MESLCRAFRGWVIVLAALAAGGGAAAAPMVTCHPIDDAEVATLFDAWAANVQAGDAQAVGGHYTKRALLKPDPKGKALRSAKARQAYYKTWLERQPTVKVVKRHVTLKCNSVTDAGTYAVRFADGSEGSGRYEMTHDWDGKHWRISRHLMTPLPAPG